MKIIDLVGENAITSEDGELVYQHILNSFEKHENVILDFEGTRFVTGTFLNHAIASLLRDYSPDFLNQNLKIINLSPYTKGTLLQVISYAKEYYEKTSNTSYL